MIKESSESAGKRFLFRSYNSFSWRGTSKVIIIVKWWTSGSCLSPLQGSCLLSDILKYVPWTSFADFKPQSWNLAWWLFLISPVHFLCDAPHSLWVHLFLNHRLWCESRQETPAFSLSALFCFNLSFPSSSPSALQLGDWGSHTGVHPSRLSGGQRELYCTQDESAVEWWKSFSSVQRLWTVGGAFIVVSLTTKSDSCHVLVHYFSFTVNPKGWYTHTQLVQSQRERLSEGTWIFWLLIWRIQNRTDKIQKQTNTTSGSKVIDLKLWRSGSHKQKEPSAWNQKIQIQTSRSVSDSYFCLCVVVSLS